MCYFWHSEKKGKTSEETKEIQCDVVFVFPAEHQQKDRDFQAVLNDTRRQHKLAVFFCVGGTTKLRGNNQPKKTLRGQQTQLWQNGNFSEWCFLCCWVCVSNFCSCVASTKEHARKSYNCQTSSVFSSFKPATNLNTECVSLCVCAFVPEFPCTSVGLIRANNQTQCESKSSHLFKGKVEVDHGGV